MDCSIDAMTSHDSVVAAPEATELDGHWNDWLVGDSDVVRGIVEQVRLFAPNDAPVLITGESGTGKEVVAKLVHYFSDRATENYVRVNCAALSETLIESELFGHEKGAFTGATEARVGRLEWAGRGTVLLDEISEIAPTLQAKLLRVLEEAEFQRVGSNRTSPLLARIIATSNRCLAHEVSKGQFREDLYYRLNVLQVDVPPVRERAEDVPALVHHFLRVFQGEGRGRVVGVQDDAMRLLREYAWPGNVRQLRNTVRRLCILAKSEAITAADVGSFGKISVPETLASHVESHSENAPSTVTQYEAELYNATLRDAQQMLVRAALQRYDGNQTAAAKHLGVSPRTLHNHLKRRAA